MKCPNCDKGLQIPNYAYNNASTYENTVLAVSNCCGKAFVIKPIISFQVTPYTGSKKEDDWGKKIKVK